MTKRKGQDFAHEWTLQIQASSVYELAKFRSILEFWSIFNNLEEILSRIPAACRIDLFKSYVKAWWHDLPGGAWIIPVPFESVAHVFTEIAMVLVGEICNNSEDIYGLMLNWNLDGANEFWVWNHTDPPTSTDFAVRIRSILDLDDYHPIEFRSQKEFGFGINGEARRWSLFEEHAPEDSEQSELSELSNGPSVLSYDRQYLKRFAFSETSQELPTAIQKFDWSLLFLPPSTSFAAPAFDTTVSTWLSSSTITKWMAFTPEEREVPSGGTPALNGELPQSDNNECIKVAEACLDELSSAKVQAGKPENFSLGIARADNDFEVLASQVKTHRTGGGPVRPSTPEGPISTYGLNLVNDGKETGQRSKVHIPSRVLQEELTCASSEKFSSALDALLPQFPDLVMDSFGHYTAEKLARLADAEQRLQLLRSLQPRLSQIACHKLGSFSLQSVMETLQTEPEIELFVEILYPHIRHIASNPSGHYVLLRCLDLFSYPATKCIFDVAVEHVVELSTDHYGLRVMKVLVQVPHNVSLERLLDEIAANTLLLVENQYGNYVIQLVLSLDSVSPDLSNAIFSRMIGRFAKLSKQKFSSNVVEQCLRRGSSVNRNQVIRELIVAVNLLIRDRFGNYVLQTALECSTKPQMVLLGSAIAKNLHLLRDNVRAKWTGILREKLGEHSESVLNH